MQNPSFIVRFFGPDRVPIETLLSKKDIGFRKKDERRGEGKDGGRKLGEGCVMAMGGGMDAPGPVFCSSSTGSQLDCLCNL